MVVVAPPPLVSPQVVVRLQQCSYILVNDCRVNAPVNRSDACGGERVLDPRSENGLFWRTVSAQPCVEEGDKAVNSCEFRAQKWGYHGICQQNKTPSCEHPGDNGGVISLADRRDGHRAGETDTGMPLRAEVPDKGSMARSSDRTFEFTPAFSEATLSRVPGSSCPHP